MKSGSIYTLLVLTLGLSFSAMCISTQSLAAENSDSFGGAKTDRGITRSFMLEFLLDEEGNKLEQEIETLSRSVETSSAGAEKGAMLRYALGALHIYRYIRYEENSDAYRAKELLEASAYRYGDSSFHKVHFGMAHAFIAKIRKVFGVGNLKEMQGLMQSIPEDHPDWLLRFFRGTTLVELGSALPGVFTIKETKEEALELGEADLRYVLRTHRRASVDNYRPKSYDTEKRPVPDAIAEQSRKILRKVE